MFVILRLSVFQELTAANISTEKRTNITHVTSRAGVSLNDSDVSYEDAASVRGMTFQNFQT